MIDSFREEALEILKQVEGLPKVLKYLDGRISKKSRCHRLLVSITAEQKELKLDEIRGLVSYQNKILHLANIRGRLIELIEVIDIKDLQDPEKREEGKADLEVINFDLPAGILLAMNQMNPEICDYKLNEIVERISIAIKHLEKASDYRDRKISEVQKKMTRLRSTEKGLQTKFSQRIIESIIPFNISIDSVALAIEETVSDFSILCIYSVQYSFQNNGISQSEVSELELMCIEGQKQIGELVVLLEKQCESEKLLLTHIRVNKHKVWKALEKSIESKVKLKEAFESFSQDVQKLSVALKRYLKK